MHTDLKYHSSIERLHGWDLYISTCQIKYQSLFACIIIVCLHWKRWERDRWQNLFSAFKQVVYERGYRAVISFIPLQWRHNGRYGVSNHQPHDCLLKRLFRRRTKKTSKLRVTGLCAGNSPLTGEFPAQMASNAENVSIWWRHHVNKCYVNAVIMR